MVAVRATDSFAATGPYIEVPLPAGSTAGDRMVVLAFGGNRVTGWYPGTLTREADTWGQEAQGSILTGILTADDIDRGWYSLNFDGGDPARVATVATVGDAGCAVMLSARDGIAGQVLPAAEFTDRVRATSNDIALFFAGVRNGTAMPACDLGVLTHSYTGAHPMGFWVDTDVGTALQPTFAIPVRSGHYRAVVRLFDWLTGPWLDDAEEVTAVIDSAAGDPYPNRIYAEGADFSEAIANALAGEGDIDVPTVVRGWRLSASRLSGGTCTITWTQPWAAVQRTEQTVDSSTVPGAWPDKALGVEWEPTSSPLRMELAAASGTGVDNDPTFHGRLLGKHLTLRIRDGADVDANGIHDPGFLDRAGLLGHAVQVATSDPIAGQRPVVATTQVDVEPVGSWIAATLVDPVVEDALTTIADGFTGLDNVLAGYTPRLTLRAYYRPRYRFQYDPLTRPRGAPPQRIFPREDRLLGGTPRIYPPPRTRQAGNRIYGGYL